MSSSKVFEFVKNQNSSLHTGGVPPYDGDMEARVLKLEDFALETRDRLTRIETKLDATATKADLMEAVNGQIKWMIVTAVGLGVAAITVMTFVLNNAVPKTAAQQAQAPIIINVPAAPVAAPVLPLPK